MDARKIGDKTQVLVGLVPIIEGFTKISQSPTYCIPLMLVNTKENFEFYDCVQKYLSKYIKDITTFSVHGINYNVEW
jgi:hypothetical protein